jgi:hypothetical protein
MRAQTNSVKRRRTRQISRSDNVSVTHPVVSQAKDMPSHIAKLTSDVTALVFARLQVCDHIMLSRTNRRMHIVSRLHGASPYALDSYALQPFVLDVFDDDHPICREKKTTCASLRQQSLATGLARLPAIVQHARPVVLSWGTPDLSWTDVYARSLERLTLESAVTLTPESAVARGIGDASRFSAQTTE